jgi:predicted CopG family antitoxin
MDKALLKAQKKDTSNHKTYYIPKDVQDMLVELAEIEGRSLSNLICWLVKKHYSEVA